MKTNVGFLQAAMGVGILLMPFLVILLTIFVLLFNLSHRILSRRIPNPDPAEKSEAWTLSMFISLAIVAAILYAVYELFLSRIVFL